MCLVDQLPCGSVLTPAISCTKFKIHSAHADSPMAKTLFTVQFFLRKTSLCFTDRKRMCLVDQLPCGSVLTPAISCKKFKIHSAHANSPMAKTLFIVQFFKGRPVFASQIKRLRKRMCLVDQLPCTSVLTPANSCTKFKIHSAHADSPMAKNIISCSIFLRKTSLCNFFHRSRNSGRECAWWTNSLVGRYLHQLSLVQSSRSIKRMQTVPWPKHYLLFNFFKEDQSLLHRSRDSGRECAWLTNSLVGRYLHQLSLVQSSRSIQRMQTVPWPKHYLLFNFF